MHAQIPAGFYCDQSLFRDTQSDLLYFISLSALFCDSAPALRPDLIYISLLIIPCIIYYVTNKETLNLEP